MSKNQTMVIAKIKIQAEISVDGYMIEQVDHLGIY